ncbi:unnamed protein product, partial [Pylaiella littoralis]
SPLVKTSPRRTRSSTERDETDVVVDLVSSDDEVLPTGTPCGKSSGWSQNHPVREVAVSSETGEPLDFDQYLEGLQSFDVSGLNSLLIAGSVNSMRLDWNNDPANSECTF